MWNIFSRFRFPRPDTSLEAFERYRDALEARNPRSETTALLEAPLLEADDILIQLLLRDTDSEVVAKALVGASDAVKRRIFNNMANRGGAIFHEDIELLSEMTDYEVAKHQQILLHTLAAIRETE